MVRRRDANSVRKLVKDLILPVVVAITLAFVIQASLAKPYEIPTNSMFPAIQGTDGDHRSPDRVIANRVIYKLRDISPGDIIVFDPTMGARAACIQLGDVPFVKRVIGVPGDQVSVRELTISSTSPYPELRPGGAAAVKRTATVKRTANPKSEYPDGITEQQLKDGDTTHVTFVKKEGQAEAQPFIVPPALTPYYTASFPGVPPGQLLVLGDNRPGSCDAYDWLDRNAEFTPEDNVIGQAELIYWPITRLQFLS
ncbi:MAG: signal peptidase I [Actinomycetota bacterium]|nr:signal peptidase I [Actinomycetota bacterium]